MSPRSTRSRITVRRCSRSALAGLLLIGSSLTACAAAEVDPPLIPVTLMEVSAHAGYSMVHVIRAGDAVRLEADLDHPFESDAVAAYWGAFKLGYLPSDAVLRLRCPPVCRAGDELPVGRIASAESGAIAVEILMPPWTMARIGD